MKQRRRPQRFIVIPPPPVGDKHARSGSGAGRALTLRLHGGAASRGGADRRAVAVGTPSATSGAAVSAAGSAGVAGANAAVAGVAAGDVATGSGQRRAVASMVWRSPAAKVVNRSPADGAVLLEPRRAESREVIAAQAPTGSKVIEEQWYRLARPARPWMSSSASLRKPRVRAGQGMAWTVRVELDAASPRRLADALVTVMTDEARGIGVEAKTDRYGRARVDLDRRVSRVQAVYVDPLHGGWPCRLEDVAVTAKGLRVLVVPIDLDAPDARGLVYGKATAGDGRGVRVAVVDTGVGRHDALTVSLGMNTTSGESPRLWRDEDGHGSHVAGVIAATAAGWRRGEASAVELHAYRIFESGDPYASTFAISAAIKDAATRGCDLVNLSIGDSVADESVRDAVDFAWARGCVCVAATGNDGETRIDYPARYRNVIAVSAIGLIDSWPDGTHLSWTLSPQRGKRLGGRDTFLASFSNRGPKVALTAPGVAVVSTIFDNRWGVMSGTSMATPIATGVIARRLAATPTVKNMPPDAARAAAIVQLAAQAAEDLHLPAGGQGKGLVR